MDPRFLMGILMFLIVSGALRSVVAEIHGQKRRKETV